MNYSALIDRQRAYFKSNQTRSLKARKQALTDLKKLILEHQTAIETALFNDLKKHKEEAYVTEIGTCIAEIDFALKHLKGWMSPRKAHTPLMYFPGKSYMLAQPYGVTLVMASWNYPFKLIVGPLIAALAAGNTAILKPSEISAHTSKLIAKLFESFNQDLVSVVQGGVEQTTELLKEKFDYIFFTGSTMVGKIIHKAAAQHLTPCTLELGGKSPAIVDQHTNLKVTAKRLVWGKFLNAGQTCVAPDYILVHHNIKEALINAIKDEIINFYSENPQSSSLPRIISDKHFRRVQGLIDGKIVFGGQTDAKDRYIAPTLIDGVTLNDKIMQEEIFGPLLPFITFKDVSKAIEIINSMAKPLSLYVFSKQKSFIEKIIANTSSGGVCVNETIMHMTSAYLPFGGVGSSGFGAYNGKFGFDTLSHLKPVMKRSFLFDIPQKYPPINKSKFNFLKFALKRLS